MFSKNNCLKLVLKTIEFSETMSLFTPDDVEYGKYNRWLF